VRVLFEGRTIVADKGGFMDNFVGVDTYGYESGGVVGDMFGYVKDEDRELPRLMPSGYGYTYGPTAVHIFMRLTLFLKVRNASEGDSSVRETRHRRRLRFGLPAMLLLLVGCGGAPKGPNAETAKPARPNVLLISLDTLRADHLGCYGYRKPYTPNLDRFAASGVRFTNCRCQTPWTLPSHMALFTSLLPTDNGVDGINKVLPSDVPTLAQLLRQEGYRTAALVNDGQMKRHWGFARGFQSWREFPVDTPAGSCPNITAQAITWLQDNAGPSPFFLFLHYYDPHAPYDAPGPYRRKTGATLTGPETRKLCEQYRTPAANLREPALLADLIAAYDAEIAWLDDELGKLLAAVPENTLVVIFSDHGEAFEEHGWMMHGATLYEEEVHVPLIVRLPDGGPKRKVVDDPVMLLDVAPTILARCGVHVPAHFQGTDLAPLWEGGQLKERLILAETKAVLEGRYCLSVTLYPLKGIYSLFDNRFELYKLPDEQTDLANRDKAAAEALRKPLRAWMDSQQFWMLHAVGQGDYEATLEPSEGGFGLFIPVGLDPERDDVEAVAKGRALHWHVYPAPGRPKALFLQPARPEAALRVRFKINGIEVPEQIYLGKDGRHPAALPVTVPADLPALSPFLERSSPVERPGFHLFRHRGSAVRGPHPRVASPDPATLRQLRSLGYLR
jgi:arylsulfatase A-like enzyme